jgi:glycosyltransferase involved in cell wall biosynthesis
VRSRRHFERLGVPASRLAFSPYCVDTTPFETEEADRPRWRDWTRRALGLTDDHIVILYAGKLSRRKGVDLLVSAVRLLPAGVSNRVAILVVGDGDERPRLQQQAERAPAVRLLVAGFQDQHHLSRYYHAADLLVLPSRHSETWGLVVNEALHHGVPCVVSDRVGCAPDLINDRTGVVFGAESVDALGAALARAFALRGRLDVRQACRSLVSGYTVEAAAEGIANAYHSSLHSRPTLEHVG